MTGVTTPYPQAPTETILRVASLTKSYALPNSRLAVLQDIELEVRRGECVAITGPSGSGKTTLLALLGALDTPDAGEIWLNEIAVHRLHGMAASDFRRQQVGFVFQLFYLLPNLTALENVMAPLLPYRRTLNFDLKQRATELLERVGLADRLGHPPARLSGGEQQRVGVARAIAARPRVLLMDEPFGAVDALVRASLQDETLRIHAALGTTIFFVTHDVDEALRVADRIVVMDAGKIVQADTPLHVLARPATPYVERLMDSKDAVRRLGLLRVRDAMAPAGDEPAQGRIAASASLRDALSAFLAGAERLAVDRDPADASGGGGTGAAALTFADVRRAVAATQAA